MADRPGQMMLAWVWLCLVILPRLSLAEEPHEKTDGAVAGLERLFMDCMQLDKTRNGTGFLPVPVWKFMKVSDDEDASESGRPQYGCSKVNLCVRLRLVQHSELRLEDGRNMSALPDGCDASVQTVGPWMLLKLPYSGCPVESWVSNGSSFYQLKLRYFDDLLQADVTAVATCQDPAERLNLAPPQLRCRASDVMVKLPLGTRLQKVEALGEGGVIGTMLSIATAPDALIVQISRAKDVDSYLEIILLDSSGEMVPMLAVCLTAMGAAKHPDRRPVQLSKLLGTWDGEMIPVHYYSPRGLESDEESEEESEEGDDEESEEESEEGDDEESEEESEEGDDEESEEESEEGDDEESEEGSEEGDDEESEEGSEEGDDEESEEGSEEEEGDDEESEGDDEESEGDDEESEEESEGDDEESEEESEGDDEESEEESEGDDEESEEESEGDDEESEEESEGDDEESEEESEGDDEESEEESEGDDEGDDEESEGDDEESEEEESSGESVGEEAESSGEESSEESEKFLGKSASWGESPSWDESEEFWDESEEFWGESPTWDESEEFWDESEEFWGESPTWDESEEFWGESPSFPEESDRAITPLLKVTTRPNDA